MIFSNKNTFNLLCISLLSRTEDDVGPIFRSEKDIFTQLARGNQNSYVSYEESDSDVWGGMRFFRYVVQTNSGDFLWDYVDAQRED
jgi:hypothetical protein